ncbi:MAG: metallophosphoesterase [Bacteroidota bacterium]
MESLNILHLSDIHFGNFKYRNPATLALRIVNSLNDDAKKVDIIIVSGDIFDGRSKTLKKDEDNAIDFFKLLIDKLKSKEICSKRFDEKSVLFVPGNHDLIRDEDGEKQYKKYDSFIKRFYGRKKIKNRIIVDEYNFIYDFPDKKIAILGFNSCRIEADREKEEDLKWINEIDLTSFKDQEKIKSSIRKFKEQQFTWDDFGYIDSVELDNVFEKLTKEIPTYTDYNLIATFHHHFYPFPERQEKKPDSSFIRNYTEVLDQFQRFNIKLVLHGHKHTPVQRAITDKKYFDNPNSIIYVLAAGSIGCKGVDNLSFHWLKIFDKNNPQLLSGIKYDFKGEEEGDKKNIQLPPKANEKELSASRLKVILQNQLPRLFGEYQELTDNFEQILQDSDADKIIEIIGSLLTVFPEIDKSLRREPLKIYLILLAINYRVILLKSIYESANENFSELLIKIEEEITKKIKNSGYSTKLLDFLKATSNEKLEGFYAFIIKNVTVKQKGHGAFVSVSVFLTDLFLNISRYGEYYFTKEKLNLKINIKLKDGKFYTELPNNSIQVRSDIDRRAIYLEFKCKDPTVHKIAVLIVKDFEMRLSKFEESLKTINLKLYYISPKVVPVNYELENFHFDAYIPTLLPLLTGDNLYSQKEVFIRELVQNAIDATLLRKKLEPESSFSTDIEITFGETTRNRKKTKYFKILDRGVGMSKFTIERYFTSIGRSFYVSEEFKELKEDNKITYNAISNFGIGFLSSFMVATEVNVKTKNIIDKTSLEIDIPNYEGCFFINKIELQEYGTEITLYEDNRSHFDFNKFETYIKHVFQGLPLNVVVNGKKRFKIESYKQQRLLLESLKNNELIFYIPFSEENKCPVEMTYEELKTMSIEDFEKFGISFNFTKIAENIHFHYENLIALNQGLLILKPYVPFELFNNIFQPKICINFPSSFIQLDVARENISHKKSDVNLYKSLVEKYY